jgi:hypothetical protein
MTNHTDFKKGDRVHIINPPGKDGKPCGIIPENYGTVKAVYKTGKVKVCETLGGGFTIDVAEFVERGGIFEEA